MIKMDLNEKNTGKAILIMGNGPSLKNLDFKRVKVDSFGMNGAYRYYKKMDWYPTYFGSFDVKVINSQKEEYINFVKDPSNRVKEFFFICDIIKNDKVRYCPPTQPTFRFEANRTSFKNVGNTGANCCQIAIDKGYKKIILIGIECNYVQFVEGTKRMGGTTLQMQETPGSNPNYAWGDYQRKGDVYNIPAENRFHLPTWKELAKWAPDNGIEVINCSDISKLDMFKKMSFEEAGVY